jgi:DNA-binding transcriptional ArsR family regulator
MHRSPKPEPVPKDSATLFAALGDETRLRIVARLCDGPMSIAKLTAGSRITRQAITKHLRVLEDAHLVHGVRHGRDWISFPSDGILRSAGYAISSRSSARLAVSANGYTLR